MNINRRILITGANGFIGKHLSKALITQDANVFKTVRHLSQHVEATTVVAELTDQQQVSRVFEQVQPEYVIHLASCKNKGDEAHQFYDTYDVNVLMAKNIIQACQSTPNFKRLITLGSCDEYGLAVTPFKEEAQENPTNAYGASKLAITKMLTTLFHSRQFPSVTLRPSIVYGPGQVDNMFISQLVRTLLAGHTFAMSAGEQRRDFLYIDDLVRAIIKSLDANNHVNGRIFNIGSGVAYQLKEVSKIVANIIGETAKVKLGAIKYRSNEVMDYSIDIKQASKHLVWLPTFDLETGLTHTIENFYA